jgi:hypothetical protein
MDTDERGHALEAREALVAVRGLVVEGLATGNPEGPVVVPPAGALRVAIPLTRLAEVPREAIVTSRL